MGLLTRQQILDADDRRKERIAVPEWGGDVYVQGLTAKDRDEFEASCLVRNGKKRDFTMQNIRAKLVCRCIVDEQGQPMFSVEDIHQLSQKSAAAMTRVFQAAQRLSGLGDEDFDELAKNSETDQKSVSSSA
jgi:hypothetical protein